MTTTTMTAEQLIDLSIRETRTVTEYPSSAQEQRDLHESLLTECDDNNEESGSGRSGAEARGSVVYWGTSPDGDEWKVEVINAPSDAD